MTRTEALDLATRWAESATDCYRRANTARQNGFTAQADTEYRHAQIEANLATAWATIAAVSHNPMDFHLEVATPEEDQP